MLKKIKLVNFIKLELSNWKKGEIYSIFAIMLIILFNAFCLNDSKIAICSAICGILYTFIAGKGKISCYFFGLLGTFCYSYLSFKNALWGNLALYSCYYFPMQIMGIFAWKKKLNKKQEIIKTSLNNKKRLILLIVFLFCLLIVIPILYFLNDAFPILDGVVTTLSLFGMYLTVKRCIEQWFCWSVVNILTIVIWIKLILIGSKTYSTLLMWVVYFILGIYFYFQWSKELKNSGSI